MRSKFSFAATAALNIALAVVVLSGSLMSTVSAQSALLVENFDYNAGTLLTANGWTAHSGAGTNAITVTSPGLTYSGYPSSGVGNAVSLTTSGEDVSRTFAPPVTTGSVYAAFLVNVSASQTTGDYFFHLIDTAGSTNFRGRVFIRKDSTTNNFAFGISKASTTTVAYTNTDYTPGTTYLVVLKYTFNSGSTTDDNLVLYVNPALASEPASPTIAYTDTTSTDLSQAGVVALRQGASASAPTLQLDGIRVGTTWASVMQATSVATDAPVDMNGDSKTDFVVVRNTGGGAGGQVTWITNINGTSTSTGVAWGISTDFFVPEDFDGDGKDDYAVWRPGVQGVFYILQSQTNTVRIDSFGQTGDDPSVVADYDGDGRADPAVYRAGATPGAQSTWFYRASGPSNPSGGTITFVPWGQNGDFPAPGDYDGDAKNDFAVQRNIGGGQGGFFIRLASGAIQPVVAFGTSTDVVVPGDYDGDAKTDIAIARAVSGSIQWWVRASSNGGVSAATWGLAASDFPAQGDYNGDGRTDFAIWRTGSQGAFWALVSGSGAVIASPWGQTGDYPVANYNAH